MLYLRMFLLGFCYLQISKQKLKNGEKHEEDLASAIQYLAKSYDLINNLSKQSELHKQVLYCSCYYETEAHALAGSDDTILYANKCLDIAAA